jgi:sugar lactone lactonase YvrE
MQPLEIIRVANELGEGVLWDGGSLWWTNIEGRQLFRLDWQSRALQRIDTPQRLCSFGFTQSATQLIAAFESGIALFDTSSGKTEWLWRLGKAGQRLNDGRVDRQGRFWTGAMAETADQSGKAELYCVDAGRQVHASERGITISNAIAWSPDGSMFYFADSPSRSIWRYKVDGDEISEKRVFARTPPGVMPDGATVDAEGCLWNAQWGGRRVVRYSPDGRVDRVLELPVSQPTCVAFGGPRLDLLFVTSARIGLSKEALDREPSAGDVLVYNAGIVGLPENRFRFEGLPTGE